MRFSYFCFRNFTNFNMKIPASELVVNSNGSIYHLNLLPSDISNKIILVGDPNRVDIVAQFFDSVRVKKSKREFHTITGIYKGDEITVISTGIGTDNIDIVINELDALVNIDLQEREVKAEKKTLTFLRLGTCGGVQSAIPVGSFAASTFGIGMDGLLNFYERTISQKESDLEQNFENYMNSKKMSKTVPSYANKASIDYPKHEKLKSGITITATGFYGPQARNLQRMRNKLQNFEETLAGFDFNGEKIINIEMETAAIFGLANELGHKAGAISVILANRIKEEFAENPKQLVLDLVEFGLDVIKDQ